MVPSYDSRTRDSTWDPVEASPSDCFETQAGQDRLRHGAAPNRQAGNPGLAGHVEARCDHRAVDPPTSELGPDRAAVDDRSVGRKEAQAGAARRFAVDQCEDEPPVAARDLVTAPALLRLP